MWFLGLLVALFVVDWVAYDARAKKGVVGSCSIPQTFGLKKWFDERFSEACDEHDAHYVARDCWKMQADMLVSARIAMVAPRHIPLGILAFIALTINPVAYRMWLT